MMLVLLRVAAFCCSRHGEKKKGQDGKESRAEAKTSQQPALMVALPYQNYSLLSRDSIS